MDDLRDNVQNASYEQKDPLVIYKLESFNLFKQMIGNINQKVTSTLMHAQIPVREPESVRGAMPEQQHSNYDRYKTQKAESPMGNAALKDTREQQRPEPVHAEKRVGRNDPCPCGSGLKYKNCHGKGL